MNTDTNNSPAHARMPVQAYARAAGLLFLITFVAGGFGEGYAPAISRGTTPPRRWRTSRRMT